jgi:hypothetical protein
MTGAPSRLYHLIAISLCLGCGKEHSSRSRAEAPPGAAVPTTSDAPPVETSRGAGNVATEVPDTGPTYVVHGACPFECCQYGQWSLLSSAVLRTAAAVGSDSTGTLTPGDSVTADSGVVVFQPTGLVVMLTSVTFDDSVRFEPGDTVELLAETGEGWRNVIWRGRHVKANVDDWESYSTSFRVLRRLHSTWWVHMTHPRTGRRGWIDMTRVRVGGADRCG